MSNKHRKRSAPQAKPTIEEFMRATIRVIHAAFLVPMKVTIVVRHPLNHDAEIVFSDDDMDALIETLQRRRDAVIASRPVADQPPA